MKSITFVTILAAFIVLSACGQQLDRTDVRSFSLAVLKAVDDQDTTLLQNLHADSLKPMNPDARTGYLKFNTNSFVDRDLAFVRLDTTAVRTGRVQYNLIDIYCKHDTTFYRLALTYRRHDRGLLALDAIAVHNLTDQCIKYNREPYSGRRGDVAFKNFHYSFDPRGAVFSNCSVEAYNDTGFDLDYLRFRVVLIVNKQEVFNRTLEYSKKFFKGDVVHIDVPELNGFQSRVPISTNLTWEAGVIEILPKPVSKDCTILNELQSL
jgi:hypothetical protein